VAVLVVFLGAAGFIGYKFVLPWWQKKPPPPSGKELQVHVLDVGQGDSILIISPENKVVLIDAGDEKSGKMVVDALKRNNVQQIDYFIATHTHPDHIGGAAEVLRNFKVGSALWNDFPPPEATTEETANKAGDKKQGKNPSKNPPKPATQHGKVLKFPTVEAFDNFRAAVEQGGAELKKAEPDQKIDLGGGAVLTVLAPIPPPFTREQAISARDGNESNANSIVIRLDYGDFSMLLTGDAEAQTEERLVSREANLAVNVLKVAHHGSKYATSENFLKRVFRTDNTQPKAAVISDGEFNRYGHPSQDVLTRLKAAGATLYRTDLQGEITITTTGKLKEGKLYEIKAAKETKSDLWAGREGQRDDSSRSGFISYGDFGPPPRQRKKP
jgi:beta-lactamase superfamily II metal-dependent hydrolase